MAEFNHRGQWFNLAQNVICELTDAEHYLFNPLDKSY